MWAGPEIDREFPSLRSPVKLVLRKECSIFPGRATRGRRREKALAYLREVLVGLGIRLVRLNRFG